ncbi:uncharacterized protein LOC111706450 [Eurytemora carolleeae]|uniref:uncharacterized protein LOC111706450 n=1 Tax=Eurytemora carolleeae TaxID=1294199 RepID=UPI000C79410B|nr:uncharacterized protein LOC111706450 [Eurytemora carolleeae]|eukprot:XP_023335096.1 uncharacterized protein LOC111706450 [Eurytemora affinis]
MGLKTNENMDIEGVENTFENAGSTKTTDGLTETLEFFQDCENGLNRLPPEIWRNIVSRVAYEDYPCVRNVCNMFREFLDACPLFWNKKLILKVPSLIENQRICLKKIRQYSVLEHFALVGVHEVDKEKTIIPEQFIKNLAETCTSLSSLLLEYCKLDLSALLLIEKSCDKLQIVRLTEVDLLVGPGIDMGKGLFHRVLNISLDCTFINTTPTPDHLPPMLPVPDYPGVDFMDPMEFQANDEDAQEAGELYLEED